MHGNINKQTKTCQVILIDSLNCTSYIHMHETMFMLKPVWSFIDIIFHIKLLCGIFICVCLFLNIQRTFHLILTEGKKVSVTNRIHDYIQIHLYRGVVVKWICHRTVDHKVRGSSPVAALMSFGKTLIYICLTRPRWGK